MTQKRPQSRELGRTRVHSTASLPTKVPPQHPTHAHGPLKWGLALPAAPATDDALTLHLSVLCSQGPVVPCWFCCMRKISWAQS